MLLWNFATNAGVSALAVANGVVYCGAVKLYALKASTGAKLWSYDTDNGAGSPVVSNGVVYVGDYSGNVYAFRPELKEGRDRQGQFPQVAAFGCFAPTSTLSCSSRSQRCQARELRGRDNCRNQAWLLKNSGFAKRAEIWEIENVYQTEIVVCRASYCKVFSDHFLVSEFFNTHRPLHSSSARFLSFPLIPERAHERTPAERELPATPHTPASRTNPVCELQLRSSCRSRELPDSRRSR